MLGRNVAENRADVNGHSGRSRLFAQRMEVGHMGAARRPQDEKRQDGCQRVHRLCRQEDQVVNP